MMNRTDKKSQLMGQDATRRDETSKFPLTSLHLHVCLEIFTIIQVNLYIDKLPQSSSGGAGAGNSSSTDAYKCVFDKKEQTVANRTAFGLSCPLPSVMNRPKIQPGKGIYPILLHDLSFNPPEPAASNLTHLCLCLLFLFPPAHQIMLWSSSLSDLVRKT